MPLPAPSDSSVALITGASSGIGEAIAAELAGRGQNVALVARRQDRLTALAERLAGEHGVRAEAIAADLGGEPGRDEMATKLSGLGLDVNILVNNAGYGGGKHFANSDRDRLLGMVRLNIEALVDLQARYLPPMVERGAGTVINIASTSAFQPLPGTATYAASKSFVLSLSEAVHAELRGTGVTLTAVCPGPVKTEFMEAANLNAAEENTPDIFWMSAEDVARESVEAAEKGKRVVVPGLLNRAGAITGQHAPRALMLPLAKRIWSLGT
jgi:short-subunit dehydrogenase